MHTGQGRRRGGDGQRHPGRNTSDLDARENPVLGHLHNKGKEDGGEPGGGSACVRDGDECPFRA